MATPTTPGLVRAIHYNVKDYGAVGDGVTDDRAAFQAAVDEAFANRGVVVVPAGCYAVSGQIKCDKYDSNFTHPFPSVIGSPGRAGPSLDFATNATEWESACSHMIKPIAPFPVGEYIFDWIGSNAQDRSAAGFRISGLVFNCNGRGAGIRMINPFCMTLADIVVDNKPVTPNPAFEPSRRDGSGLLDSSGAVAILGAPTQNSFFNTIRGVYVRSAALDGIQLASGPGSYDLVSDCCVNNSGRYGIRIEDKAHVFNSIFQANAQTKGLKGADIALGRYNVMVIGGGAFSGKPKYGNGLRCNGGPNGNQKVIGVTLYGGENPSNDMLASDCAAIQVTKAQHNLVVATSHIFTGVNTKTSSLIWTHPEASGHITVTGTQFDTSQGSPLTGPLVNYNGREGIYHFENCPGINPSGTSMRGDIGVSSPDVSFDRREGELITATLKGNVNITLQPGIAVGDIITIALTQGSTGGWAATWSPNFKKRDGALTLSTAPGAIDVVCAQWNGISWMELSRSLNLS